MPFFDVGFEPSDGFGACGGAHAAESAVGVLAVSVVAERDGCGCCSPTAVSKAAEVDDLFALWASCEGWESCLLSVATALAVSVKMAWLSSLCFFIVSL